MVSFRYRLCVSKQAKKETSMKIDRQKAMQEVAFKYRDGELTAREAMEIRRAIYNGDYRYVTDRRTKVQENENT